MRTTKHIRRAGMALMAVAALALSGCSNSSDGNSDERFVHLAKELPGSDYAKADRDAVQDGGTLRLAITAIPTSWNGDSALGRMLISTPLWLPTSVPLIGSTERTLPSSRTRLMSRTTPCPTMAWT